MLVMFQALKPENILSLIIDALALKFHERFKV